MIVEKDQSENRNEKYIIKNGLGVSVLEYFYPDYNNKICILKEVGSKNGLPIGEKLSTNSSLYKKILSELEFGFHQSMIKINQCSRNLMKDFDGPNVLFLSNNEGGYARKGIIIKDCDTYVEYPNLNYVDLVIDEKRLENGELQILTHELGHVIMANILNHFPDGKSVKQHTSMGITDYYNAFNEGWAVHFERLSYDNIEHYAKLINSKYSYTKDIVKLWHCEIDSSLRIDGVLKNSFIYKKLLPKVDTSNMDLKDIIILEHTSPIFDTTRLKNAQEMLSCEGVLATLFYRINTNPILQNNCLDCNFYNNFLLYNINESNSIRQLFSPLENVMLKNLWIWNRIREKIGANSIPFIEFLKEWCTCFPNDSHEILKLFISTTIGKTINNDLEVIFEKLSMAGMTGKINEFMKIYSEYKVCFEEICEKTEAGEYTIDGNIGNEIWIDNLPVKIPVYLWSDAEQVNLSINLNTASEYELQSFPEITPNKAREIIEKRDTIRYLTDIKDIE